MDREAEFRRLYDAHRDAVHAYLIGRLCGRPAAADLLQEVFMRVWRYLDTVAGLPADGQRGWIFTVARNLSIDAVRHDRTLAGTEQALAAEPPKSAAPASDMVISAERAAIVGAAIRRLPEPQRITLALAAAGGLTSAEIGAALGIPAGTARYRLSLARRALADALGDYDAPDDDAPDNDDPDYDNPGRNDGA
ncbi:MAG: RNA polymerase sigma factor, partial [Trebonia sp.]